MTENDIFDLNKTMRAMHLSKEITIFKEGADAAYSIREYCLPKAIQNLGDIILITDKDAAAYLDKFTNNIPKRQQTWSEDNMMHGFAFDMLCSKIVCISEETNPAAYKLCNQLFNNLNDNMKS